MFFICGSVKTPTLTFYQISKFENDYSRSSKPLPQSLFHVTALEDINHWHNGCSICLPKKLWTTATKPVPCDCPWRHKPLAQWLFYMLTQEALNHCHKACSMWLSKKPWTTAIKPVPSFFYPLAQLFEEFSALYDLFYLWFSENTNFDLLPN